MCSDTFDTRALFLFTEGAEFGASRESRVGIATLKGPVMSFLIVSILYKCNHKTTQKIREGSNDKISQDKMNVMLPRATTNFLSRTKSIKIMYNDHLTLHGKKIFI